MRMHPFSIEQTMQLGHRSEAPDRARQAGRRPQASVPLGPEAASFGQPPAQWPRSDARARPAHRIVALDAMRLHGPSYSVLDGVTSLLLTHVLRHSPGALKWRNGSGELSHLEPGGVFLNQGRMDSLVEVSPSPPEDPCDCVRVVLRTRPGTDLALRYEANDFLFCNSPQACVRVLLGSYRGHVARSSPMPDLTLLDIDIAPFSEIEIPVSGDQFVLAILTSGSLTTPASTGEPWHAMVFQGGGPSVRLATHTGASVLWLGVMDPQAAAKPQT
jgi:hypothetical protein